MDRTIDNAGSCVRHFDRACSLTRVATATIFGILFVWAERTRADDVGHDAPTTTADDSVPIDEDMPATQPTPDPRLLSLPLPEQVCESTPPHWARSNRETAFVREWSQGPLFLDESRILWGRHIIDATTGELLEEFPFGQDALLSKARMSYNRRYLLVSRSTPFDQTTFGFPTTWLQVWDVETRTQHGKDLALDRFGEIDAAVTEDGNTVAVASRAEVNLWDTLSGERNRTLPVNLDDFEEGYQGRPAFFAPEFLRFSPDNHWLVVFSPNNVIYSRWQTGEIARVLHVGRRLEEFAFTPDSRYLAEGPGPRTNLHVREMGSFDISRTLFDEVDSPMITTGLAFTPDGETLIAGNDVTVDESKLTIPHRLHFWDLQTGTLIRQMAMPLYRPRWLDVSPNGRWLAVRLENHETTVLAVWHLAE